MKSVLMQKVLRTASAAVLAVGLSAAAVGASTGSISGPTGPNSTNKVKISSHKSSDIDNNNNVSLSNSNSQTATTGKSKVKHNTTGGDATSGDAENTNDLSASLTIDNTGCSCNGSNGSSSHTGTISGATGPDSYNKVSIYDSTHFEVENNNNITLTNSNSQTATSGNASVSGNTTGGDATSGNASNNNSSTFNLTVTN